MRKLLLLIGLSFYGTVYAGINEWTYVGLAPEYINSIEVDPTNSDIVYVSAGDVYWDSTREGGLFRTTDRGATWDTLGFRHSNVFDISIDRTNPQTLWIANDYRGVWRSTDQGGSWENRSNGIYIGGVDGFGPEKIAVCPHDSRYMMCLTGSLVGSGETYFTDVAGNQWQEHPTMYVDGERFVSFDNSSPGVVYVTDWNRDYAYISVDTGRSFRELSPYGYASMYGLKTAPSRAGTVWRMTWELGLQVSYDYGRIWSRETERFFGSDTVIFDMDAVGRGDTLVFATGYGLFLTLDGGDSVFALIDDHTPITPIDVVRIVSILPFEIWAVRRNHGIWTFTVTDSTNTAVDYKRSFLDGHRRHFTIYPNPTNGMLWIDHDRLPEGSLLDVYNVLGQLVKSICVNEDEIRTQVFLPGNLSSGIYFVAGSTGATNTPVMITEKSFLLVK